MSICCSRRQTTVWDAKKRSTADETSNSLNSEAQFASLLSSLNSHTLSR